MKEESLLNIFYILLGIIYYLFDLVSYHIHGYIYQISLFNKNTDFKMEGEYYYLSICLITTSVYQIYFQQFLFKKLVPNTDQLFGKKYLYIIYSFVEFDFVNHLQLC